MRKARACAYRFLIASLMVCLFVDQGVQAGTRQVYFEACIADSSGTSPSDGPLAVRLKIYSGPTRVAPLWESEEPVNVVITEGCFSHMLGSSNSLPKSLEDYPGVWVGISVESGPEIWPRTYVRTDKSAPQDAEVMETVASSEYRAPAWNSTRSQTGPVPDLYLHAMVSFGLGGFSADETYEAIVSPFQPQMGMGYALGLTVGFRNIYQFQYRPRVVSSSDLNAFDIDSVIPMDFHIRNELVHKLNLLAFQKPTKKLTPCLFVSYGTAGGEGVRHVDKVGSGFLDGSSKMFGLEAGLLQKSVYAAFAIERRAATFRRFEIVDLGYFEEEIKATFWSFGFQVSVGSGFWL